MNAQPHLLSRISPGRHLGFRDLVAFSGLDPYGQHQLLWRFFDFPRNTNPDQTRFLFRAEVRNGLPLFYVISRVVPEDSTGKWRIEPKEYRPDLRAGDILAFKLRANPVSYEKRDRDLDAIQSWSENREKEGLTPKDPTRKRIRHDVVMDAKKRMNWSELSSTERPALSRVAYDAGSSWLREREQRLGCRIVFDRLRVDGHHVYRMKRRRGIVISTLDFEGELELGDPAAFVSALFSGIGPAKAFGCGLMLVRRLDTA